MVDNDIARNIIRDIKGLAAGCRPRHFRIYFRK